MSMPVETITINEHERIGDKDFVWRTHGAVKILVCRTLEEQGFTNAFSTRGGGVSRLPEEALNLAGFDDDAAENIHENRRRFLLALDGDWQLATAWQVHGADVCHVNQISGAGSDEGEGYTNDAVRCDALTTTTPGVLVSVKTADCVPVLLADERTGACAAVHAGWRGTLARIIERTLHHMRERFGTEARDVRAAIGPAALGCCYEVGADVTNLFGEKFIEQFATPTRAGHWRINLHGANRAQLTAAGVEPERIHIAPFCTMHHNDLFFSYRVEKQLAGRTGRLLAVIGRSTAVGEK